MAAGDEVGRYRLEAQLRQGAWRAVDSQTGERVRLRYVDPFGEAPVFLAGARRLCTLDEPRILTLRDAGVDTAGEAWVAEPWQPGETLAERVARLGPLPADQLLVVAEALLSGLAAAHARGICDGAITPERLRISGESPLRVQLVCPGLAALIMDLVPDPMFSAPEGSVPTVPADLFGTAATLCFAATGQTVPSGRALELAAPRLPTPLVDTLRMCLDPDPSDRPHSVGALLRTVEALRAGTLDWGDRPAEPARAPA
ncbi:MAG: hypothetical protein KC549_14790, partial [Myxococcales bacterium]|nr:hypothetical protein [Myxococcales bacterium]